MRSLACGLGALVVCALAACENDSTHRPDVSGVTFEDFRQEAMAAAGPDAVDCGHVPLGEDRSTVNCCVASNYAQAVPVFASYEEQGIDSHLATAPVVNAALEVTSFRFDSDPTGGGRSDNGRVWQTACNDPQVPDDVCSNPEGLPFQCSP